MTAKNKNAAPNPLDMVDYNLSGLPYFQILIGSSILFVLGFFLYFPFVKKFEQGIHAALENVPGCKISYGSLNLEFFLPKVIISNVNVPSYCFKTSNDLYFEKINLNFTGMSFSPIGLSTSLATQIEKDKIKSYQSIGLGRQVFKIEDQSISFNTISKLVSLPLTIDGDLIIGALAQFQNNQVDEALIRIKSKNLMIPAQTVLILGIPELAIGNVSLKAELMNPTQVKLEELIIGDERSPIRANFRGMIYPVQGHIPSSRIDLKGELAISEELMADEKFALLKMFLSQFSQKDGFYQIKLGGTIGQPRTSSL
ncbi:MAG: hypothetical protein JNM93_13640 [Bacteriovoracaceae bacterium]|nr:hypothetical protein [Bacteriovoracaceae bacterium]